MNELLSSVKNKNWKNVDVHYSKRGQIVEFDELDQSKFVNRNKKIYQDGNQFLYIDLIGIQKNKIYVRIELVYDFLDLFFIIDEFETEYQNELF